MSRVPVVNPLSAPPSAPPDYVCTQAAASKYNVAEFSSDAMDVINHPDVDAVWICSPSQFHADQVCVEITLDITVSSQSRSCDVLLMVTVV